MHRWRPQLPQTGVQGSQLGQIEIHQVVAQEEFYNFGEIVQFGQGPSQTVPLRGEG